MSSHCCRVFANVCMLLVLMIWLPFSHSSQTEYWLSQGIYKKLEVGFYDVNDVPSFKSYLIDSLETVYYPIMKMGEEYITDDATVDIPTAFAKTKFEFHEDISEAVPHLMVVGKVCMILHYSEKKPCPSRAKANSDWTGKCKPIRMKMGDQETGARSSFFFEKYNRQDEDVNFGGGITSNWFISGFHG